MKPFKRLLVHRCTLIIQGKVTGRDPYGRDIIGESKEEDVSCRFDQIRIAISTDQYGNDFITRNMFFFDSDIDINMNTKIENVKDSKGNTVLEGSFSITDILPIYRGSDLHHYEVEVQRM